MSDVIMNDREDSLPTKIKKMEVLISELQNAVGQLTFALTETRSALTETRSVLTEVKNVLISTRHNTNEHMTDLYGAIDHLIINGGNFHAVHRQKIPIKHYV